MSHTLIMRLAGPMQSWGVSSRFGIRETLSEPSKSGVIGLLCAALGWDRAAPSHPIAGKSCTLTDLSAMPFGVRVIREGILRRDYHTAQNVLRAKAKLKPGKPANPGDLQDTVLSERFYLSDAYFLVGFESPDEALLLALETALANPHWPLSLGRKAFVPSWPVCFRQSGEESSSGVLPGSLATALLTVIDPVLVTGIANNKRVLSADLATRTLRLITDTDTASSNTATLLKSAGFVPVSRTQRADVPLSFEPRRFLPREVITYMHPRQQPD